MSPPVLYGLWAALTHTSEMRISEIVFYTSSQISIFINLKVFLVTSGFNPLTKALLRTGFKIIMSSVLQKKKISHFIRPTLACMSNATTSSFCPQVIQTIVFTGGGKKSTPIIIKTAKDNPCFFADTV